jgi:hypothetical protein
MRHARLVGLTIVGLSVACAPSGVTTNPEPFQPYEPPAACGDLALTVHEVGTSVPDSLRLDKAPRLNAAFPVLWQPADRPWNNRARVVARFVIDSTGLPIPCTWDVRSATDQEYERVARETLMLLRFYPAQHQGHPVAALIQQRFAWKARPGSASER